jgi:hypothetical protein
MNLLDAAYNLVRRYPGGAESLGPRLSKSPTTLNHEVLGTGGAKLGLLTAQAMTDMSGDLAILSAWATDAGQMLVPLPVLQTGERDDCMVRMAAMAEEFGRLCTEVAGDLGDGQISDNELRRIDKESGQMIAAIHALREALARRNAACKGGSALACADRTVTPLACHTREG